MRLNLIVLLGLACVITPGIAHGQLRRLDPFNKNNGYGRHIEIPRPSFGGGQSTSGLTVLSPPTMNRDGYIFNGTTRSDYSSSRVDRGQLRHDAAGRGWWYSSYSDSGGKVNSPVRAFPKYDRSTPPSTQPNSTSPPRTSATATLVNASGSDVQLYLQWSSLQNESSLITLRPGERRRITGPPNATSWVRFDSSPYDEQIHEQRFRLETRLTTRSDQPGYISIFRTMSPGRVGLFDR